MSDPSANCPRLANESDRQWFAYCCWRDMPQPRTIEGAYAIYRAGTGGKSRKPSGDWGKWRKQYKWDERSEAFDHRQKEVFRDATIALNSDEFFNSLEDHRQILKTAAGYLKSTAVVLLQANAIEAHMINQKYMKDGKVTASYTKEDRATLVGLNKDNIIGAEAFREGREVFNEAHHLDGVADALKDRMEKK
jgi:hypothetical protein